VQPEPIYLETACVTVVIDHQMAVIQVQVGKNFIDDVLNDGGSGVNIIIENLKVQLGFSKLNPTPYNLHMAYQTIAKPLGLIKDLKIFVHIPYALTFIVIDHNVLNFSYSMLLGRPWLKYAKVSHNWESNIITIQGIGIVRTILVIKKLGVQTKRPKVLMCYDFHFGILNDKKDVMFAMKLGLFSIGTIVIPTHIELVFKLAYILHSSITKPFTKQHVELICVLVINLTIPPNIVKQHLPKTFFHPKVREMIID
jgi:hypothetical protein